MTKLSPSSHIISISFLYQWLQHTFNTMVLTRLLALSLFIASLASSQHTNPPGVKSNSDTDNLSFPWSRLRLPRYPKCSFFKIPGIRKLTGSFLFFYHLSFKLLKTTSTHIPLSPGTLSLFTTTSSCTPISQHSVSGAQYRFRLTYRTTQTGLYCTARDCRSSRPLYWTRTLHTYLTR